MVSDLLNDEDIGLFNLSFLLRSLIAKGIFKLDVILDVMHDFHSMTGDDGRTTDCMHYALGNSLLYALSNALLDIDSM